VQEGEEWVRWGVVAAAAISYVRVMRIER